MSRRLRGAPLPLYQRVKGEILSLIDSGALRAGNRLPSEHELVAKFGVSRMTVHRAVRELSDRGLVKRIVGVGSFVAAPEQRSPLIEVRDIAEDIASRGHRHSQRLVKLEAVRADPELAAALQLKPLARLFHSIVVHLENDVPVQLEERFIVPAFAPRYLSQDFARISTTDYLKSIALPTEVVHTVHAVSPDARTRRLLHIEAREPCLRMTRQTWVRSGPATKSLFTYPGSRYSLGTRYMTADAPTR